MTILRTIATLLLAALFAVATTGVSVVYHYCAGKLDSVGLYTGGKVCGCGAESAKSCCQDKVAFHKIDTDCRLNAPVPSAQILAVVALPMVVHYIAIDSYNTDFDEALPVDTSPPKAVDIPALTCSLLI